MKLSERIKLSNEAMNEAAAERLARADAILKPTKENTILYCYKSYPTDKREFKEADAIWRVFMAGWTESEVYRVIGVAVGAVLFFGSLWWICHVLTGGGF